MAKKQNKKKNTNSKKRKIIVGVVCGIFAAAAIGTGLGIGLTKCSPSKPTNKFTIYFTPAPGDDHFVVINTTSRTINAGQNFAYAKKGITASKHTDEGDWTFQWWYKDGEDPTNPIEDDIVFGMDPYVKSLTVHPYFIPPIVGHTVNFSNGGDPNIKFNVPQLEYKVEDGSTLEDLLKESKISATKTVGDVDWIFRYWTLDLNVEEWQKPRNYGGPSPITEDITLYPYFEEPKTEWIEKTIAWETYAGNPPQEVSKEFVLPPESENTTTFTTTISNFVLSYTDPSIQTVPELQDGEKVTLITNFPKSGIYKDVEIETILLPSTQDTTPNKLNIEFTFNNVPTDNPEVFTTPFTFDITLGLQYPGVTPTPVTIEGITIRFSDPWDAPEYEFTKSSELVTFKTNAGSKNYFVSHEDEDGHFTISRPLDNREKLEVIAVDDDGKEVENVNVEPFVTTDEDNNTYIDVGISFNEIAGIFVEHKANFKLKFVTTFEGSGRYEEVVIPNDFELVYTPDPQNPYSIVMNDTVVINGDLGENTISAQIEGSQFPYFQTPDYLTIRNLTRERLTDPDEIDEKAPIYFTTPHEKITSGVIGESNQYALQGNDLANQNLGFKIQFLNENNIPDEITSYTVELQFQFWRGDPGPNPDSPEPGVEEYEPFTREITFIFSPKKWQNYTSADWAQYRSIIVSMSAKNKNTGEIVQKLGTAWQLSNISANEAYYVTAYDVKKDYQTLTSDPYEDFVFGYSNMGAAKQYIANDSTKYIMVDSDIHSTSDVPQMTTDLLISNHDTATGEKGVDWVDEDGDGLGRLYWDMSAYGYDDLYAPNLALFKLKASEHMGLDQDDPLYDQTFRFRSAILNSWAKEEGLDPLHEDGEDGGQVSKLFETVPDDFSRNGFSYGYTGGFKSKEVTFGKGENQKTSRLVYWTDYTMKAQIGQLAYLGPDMYDNCEGYYDPLFKAGDPEEQVYHRCGAFTMTLSSFSKSSYYDDAGRGAMMLLRKYTSDGKSLESPVIAGINWNGGSNWNWPGNITPYFDVWQYGGQQVNNLLSTYKNPWRS